MYHLGIRAVPSGLRGLPLSADLQTCEIPLAFPHTFGPRREYDSYLRCNILPAGHRTFIQAVDRPTI